MAKKIDDLVNLCCFSYENKMDHFYNDVKFANAFCQIMQGKGFVPLDAAATAPAVQISQWYRLLFTVTLLPWLRKYRVMASPELLEEYKDGSDPSKKTKADEITEE